MAAVPYVSKARKSGHLQQHYTRRKPGFFLLLGGFRVAVPGTGDDAAAGSTTTLERDGATFVLSCYFYDQGEQFWVIGAGVLVNGQIVFSDMVITSGADYGDDFDPADVVRATWGSMIMTWANCNNAELELIPVLAGYEQLTLKLTRIVFESMVITSGADFGSEFDPADVVREIFGTITIDFSNCNNFTAMVDTILPEFSDIMLDVKKVVPGTCP